LPTHSVRSENKPLFKTMAPITLLRLFAALQEDCGGLRRNADLSAHL
jgi:hypothetical protein